MTTVDPHVEENLRQGFKHFNLFMMLLWRLGLGRWVNAWPEVGGRIMVITHTGRKTGIKHQTPVNYTLADGEIYCTAGFGSKSDWYQNIMANPQVELWLPDSRWIAEASDITDSEIAVKKLRGVLFASGFAGPLFGANPRTMTEQEIAALLGPYRLLCFRRISPATGPNGPFELAWVWPWLKPRLRALWA